MTRIVAEGIADAVRRRAMGYCEYCRISEERTGFEFEIDHIVARKHNGPDSIDNLAWTCYRCNLRKGTDLSSIDPVTGRVASLFHPRKNKWRQHFEMKDGVIRGLSPKARATISLLRMNEPDYVESRREYFKSLPNSSSTRP